MKRLHLHLLTLLILIGLTASGPAVAKDDIAAREKAARKLIQITGAGELGVQAMRQTAETMRANPSVPAGFVDKLLEKATAEALIELVVPIYVKHLDLETMEAAIKFYETPAGKNLISATPLITQESMVAGQAWGIQLAQEILTETAAPKKMPPTPK